MPSPLSRINVSSLTVGLTSTVSWGQLLTTFVVAAPKGGLRSTNSWLSWLTSQLTLLTKPLNVSHKKSGCHSKWSVNSLNKKSWPSILIRFIWVMVTTVWRLQLNLTLVRTWATSLLPKQLFLLVFHKHQHNMTLMLIQMLPKNVVTLFLTKCMKTRIFLKKSTSKLKQLMYQMAFFHLRRKLAMSHT